VKTPSGDKPIEGLRVGDQVLAADPETGEPQARTVTHTFERTSLALLDLRVSGTTITCTPEHMFRTAAGEWRRADDLRPGSRLVTVSGELGKVESISRREGRFTVYNIEVGQLHTYYVSSLGVLAHNQNCSAGAGDYEKLAGSDLRQMNAAIAEYNGYQDAINSGQVGIQEPGNVNAPGPDYVTYDPGMDQIVAGDAKYRSSGIFPSGVPDSQLQGWMPQIEQAINAMTDGPYKTAAQQAFASGQVIGQVYTWPK
jgi:hypothetical protein